MRTIDNFALNDNYKGFSVIKKISTKLVPVGKTRENIDKYSIISNDEIRKKDSDYVKSYIDRIHKNFINSILSKSEINWNELYQAFENYMLLKDRKTLKLCQNKYRTEISKLFKSDETYKKIFGKQLFEELLPEICTEEEMIYVKKFTNFYSYFTNFNSLRKNLYENKEKHNQIPFRIVNENFPVFFNNTVQFKSYCIQYPDFFNSDCFKEFKISAENIIFPVSNDEINAYNLMISGHYDEKKCISKGINQEIKEYNDKNKTKIPFFKKLNLNILSDRQPLFTISKFNSTKEILDEVKTYADIFTSFQSEFKNIKWPEELDKIFISAKHLNNFSHIMTGNFSNYKNALSFNDIKSKEYYSFKEINESFYRYAEASNIESSSVSDITSYFRLLSAFNPAEFYDKIDFNSITDIQTNKEQCLPVKKYLEELLKFFNLFRIISIPDVFTESYDAEYYSFLNKWIPELEVIVLLYNKTRNFVTQKITVDKRVKLNFECTKFMGGWDYTEEKNNCGFLFHDEENNKYYLGVLNKLSEIKTEIPEKSNSSFKKMFLKAIVGPNKALPHAFLSGKGIDTFNPSPELLENYKNKKHIKGENFDINFCHELIDYFKNCMKTYKNYKDFTFNFSQTETYNDISEFYAEVVEAGYNLEMKGVDKDYILKSADEGNIFLFEITNKYLSGKAHSGDRYTQLFKTVFAPENNFIKLNGNSEIYFRPALIEKNITHKKGSFIVNKNTKSGLSIPEETYFAIYNHLNYGNKLSPETQLLFDSGEIVYKKADRDLIKNRRFTEENFTFNCPVTINYKARDMFVKEFNDRVIEAIKDSDVNILAVNRGEHNLITTVLIDRKGNVLERKNYNLLSNKNLIIDFKDKLHKKEIERAASRLEWQEIEDIARLKDGYLSLVTGEIADSMIRNNAVLVMESLSSEFKNSRALIERNIYSRFETKLINKLSCLTFKNAENNVPGGLYHPYQLVPLPKMHMENDLQFGWIFFMNAAFISRICSEEKYVNVFSFSEITNFKTRKAYLSKFESIKKLPENAGYEFTFERKKFNKNFYGIDTLVCGGIWHVWNSHEKKIEEINVTETLNQAFTLINCTAENENFTDKINELDYTLIYNSSLELILKCFRCCAEKKEHVNNEIQYKGISWDYIAAYNLALKMKYIMENGMNLSKKNVVLNFKTADMVSDFNKDKAANL